jgi:hypothetical protein
MALLLHVIAHESCKQDRSNEICNQQAIELAIMMCRVLLTLIQQPMNLAKHS